MTAIIARVFYWLTLAITCVCGIAAVTIFAAIVANKLSGEFENWTAVCFCALAGGLSWIAGHVVRSSLAEGRWR